MNINFDDRKESPSEIFILNVHIMPLWDKPDQYCRAMYR